MRSHWCLFDGGSYRGIENRAAAPGLDLDDSLSAIAHYLEVSQEELDSVATVL